MRYNVIGLMSGTSIDGLDIVFCSFKNNNGNWNFEIKKSHTVVYNKIWKNKLSYSHRLSAFELIKLHKDYGNFIGENVNIFLKDITEKIDFISSHGHTVFHQTDKKITFQLGDGANICAKTKKTTISDFRNLDVALGGQGAPLVPIGDKYLFSDYDICINLGGFANLSFEKNKKRIAFDICPVNIAINFLSKKIGKDFDKDGLISKNGKINNFMLKKLNDVSFYQKEHPKSLSREYFEKSFLSILEKENLKIEDSLRTVYEHIVIQINDSIKDKKSKKILLTGGGAHNKFLLELLKEKTNHNIFIPKKQIVDFKEAIIFAFLGVLRYEKTNNCLSSVTGATKNNIGGSIFLAN
ncbi:MAG: anhydro-N-acetylmuramic acid kinase [Bacteroidetes bacterium 4572_128]|nr:MAG: anhydro-N-acetylmuramic acid kinase [Bacteroidetes bacterium 4572_128]